MNNRWKLVFTMNLNLTILLILVLHHISFLTLTSPISHQTDLSKRMEFSQDPINSKFLYSSSERHNFNVISSDGAFEGYNIFVLEQNHKTNRDYVNRTLFITDMSGNVIVKRVVDYTGSSTSGIGWHNVELINSTTVMFGATDGVALWNLYSNRTIYTGFIGNHEYEYNPVNNTIFTFKYNFSKIGEQKVVYETITEIDLSGKVIWSWDSSTLISLDMTCPFEDMMHESLDVTHGNSIFFDVEEDIIYYHARNQNTFYKIDHRTKQVIWGLGEYGDFTLFDLHGKQKENLFYHGHSVEKVDDDTYILFDNDKHNQTNNNNQKSRILEITVNETTMTANISWVWTGSAEYYSSRWGDADRLPNGNRLGTFGTNNHLSYTDIGARLVEVNKDGQIVWEMNFPNNDIYDYGIYRMERFRYSPVINSPKDIMADIGENVTVSWKTWYNFRSKWHITGNYSLYLNDQLISTDVHHFEKFWRSKDLVFHLNSLERRKHNLTLALSDEGGHISTDTVFVFVENRSNKIYYPILISLIGIGFLIFLKERKRLY